MSADLDRPINLWGRIVSLEEDGTILPLMCGCGGSMWLCDKCGITIMEKNENVMWRDEALDRATGKDTTGEWPIGCLEGRR